MVCSISRPEASWRTGGSPPGIEFTRASANSDSRNCNAWDVVSVGTGLAPIAQNSGVRHASTSCSSSDVDAFLMLFAKADSEQNSIMELLQRGNESMLW
jgi:hypothetical protein